MHTNMKKTFFIALGLLMACLSMNAQEKKIYTLWVDNQGALYYFYDTKANMDTRYGVVEEYTPDDYQWYVRFKDYASQVVWISIDESMKNAPLTNLTYMFYGGQKDSYSYTLSQVTGISGLEYLNTANVTSMHKMFYGMTALRFLDLSTFNFSKVTAINGMFTYCENMEAICCKADLTGVSATTDMFYGCDKLKGGKGTSYATEQKSDGAYARPDTKSQKGYFSSLDDLKDQLNGIIIDLSFIQTYVNNYFSAYATEEEKKVLADAINDAQAVYSDPNATFADLYYTKIKYEAVLKMAKDKLWGALEEYYQNEFAKLLVEGDSEACKKLVEDAQAAVTAYPYDETTSVQVNAMIFVLSYIKDIDDNLRAALAHQRAKDQLGHVLDELIYVYNYASNYEYTDLANTVNTLIENAVAVESNNAATTEELVAAVATAQEGLQTNLKALIDLLKNDTYISLNYLLEEGDSEAVKKIVDDAKALVEAFELDAEKSAQENIEAFDNQFSETWYRDEVMTAVENQRKEDQNKQALESLNASAKALKAVRNGQLIIERNGKIYQANGAQMY